MREIKFRGKRIDSGEWVYGNLVKCEHKDSGSAYIIPFITNGSFVINALMLKFISPCYAVCPSTVGQYTSLKDRNGKEIYEGDIVYDHAERRYLEVFWNEVSAGGWWFAENINGYMYPVGKIDLDWLEVKGNIYENPELLEGDEEE